MIKGAFIGGGCDEITWNKNHHWTGCHCPSGVWHVVVRYLYLNEVDSHVHLSPIEAKAVQLDPRCGGKDEPFQLFLDQVVVYCDETFMYVDALTSLSDHDMMIGITGWNQQVPIPHSLTGDNA